MDNEDALTHEDAKQIISQLIAAAGPDGIEEDVLRHQAEIAMEEIRTLKIHGAMYEAFAAGMLRVCVVDGEVRYAAPDTTDRKIDRKR